MSGVELVLAFLAGVVMGGARNSGVNERQTEHAFWRARQVSGAR